MFMDFSDVKVRHRFDVSLIFILRLVYEVGIHHGRRHREGGMCPPVRNSGGIYSPEIATFKVNFLYICQNFKLFQYFQNKVAGI